MNKFFFFHLFTISESAEIFWVTSARMNKVSLTILDETAKEILKQ
jgi:hypothetical protein